ncbi:(4Fe-4S)-binding protein [Streptomyces sp. NBC_00237]|uniref:(4Fe-4S)-binding protein n=1 Tax=Streptomyces sp. NBC_00237 TaxID=2975687 RepID=UPI002259F5D9|nr:(4Fe-4S)-binding protein [Streptomyces sp. NBC_00237]MCX5202916.1 (4Fe-4S)-binding protein [Streptomyces sp. NBC_00237]
MSEQQPPANVKEYRGEKVDVTFRPGLCLHAAECVRGLPEVFDLQKRPWITPDAAAPELVSEVVRRCPSGALQYRSHDGPAEDAEHPTVITRNAAGQLFIRGDLRVDGSQGPHHETRVMLCGCGASGNQPYCDHAGVCGTT